MDSKSESRLYVGNLDHRVTESNLIKMFTPFGEIVSEDFLWHTQGPKRGVPRGYAFIQFRTNKEAEEAKMNMNGRVACGRPLVVRFASEKNIMQVKDQTSGASCSSSCHTNRSKTIAAIKSKLRSLEEEEEENQSNSKKPKNC